MPKKNINSDISDKLLISAFLMSVAYVLLCLGGE